MTTKLTRAGVILRRLKLLIIALFACPMEFEGRCDDKLQCGSDPKTTVHAKNAPSTARQYCGACFLPTMPHAVRANKQSKSEELVSEHPSVEVVILNLGS